MSSSREGRELPPPNSNNGGVRSAWLRWKKLWRRLEQADGVWRTKRLIRQIFGSELRYFRQVRLKTSKAGDWSFAPALLTRDAVVYSLGVGEDVELDLTLIGDHGVTIHAFDPTPGAIEFVEARSLPEEFHLHELGIADFDGEAEFSGPVSEGNVCFTILERSGSRADSIRVEVSRLQTIMAQLGHSRIDLLKMDIEGAEYRVIPDMLSSGIRAKQLLVEFHHRFEIIGNEMTRSVIENLLAHGYRILHISPSGREYTFIHMEALRSPG